MEITLTDVCYGRGGIKAEKRKNKRRGEEVNAKRSVDIDIIIVL